MSSLRNFLGYNQAHSDFNFKLVSVLGRIVLKNSHNSPLSHYQGLPYGEEVLSTVKVQRGGLHGLEHAVGGRGDKGGNRDRCQELVTVLPITLQLNEVVEKSSIRTGDGLKIEHGPLVAESEGVERFKSQGSWEAGICDAARELECGRGGGVSQSGDKVRKGGDVVSHVGHGDHGEAPVDWASYLAVPTIGLVSPQVG